MTWPQPTRADHDTFCRIEGWTPVRDARGKRGTHHVTYELTLPDARVLRTRVSHPVDRTDYGTGMWRHILRDQLAVSEAEFWACVKDRTKPDRGGSPVASQRSIPADVAYQLVHRVGVSESELAAMTRDEAIARMREYWRTQ